MQQESTKLCTKCKVMQSLSEFGKKQCSPCKSCISAYNKVYREANKQRIAEQSRNFRQDNPEHMKQKDKAYREANRERLLEYDRWRYQNNHERREQLLAECKRRYQENTEEVKLRVKEYKLANPDKVLNWGRVARQKHYIARKAAEANRRVIQRRGSAPSHVGADKAMLTQMYRDQDGLCAYCECELVGSFHVDHMQPLSRAGEHDWTNFALTCGPCNLSKNNKTAEEFVLWKQSRDL